MEMIMQTVAESASTVQMHHTLFTDAVHQVSALAHAKLPESLHGRLERATALVLSGGVWVEEDGSTTHVRCTNGFYQVNGHCPCPDHGRALDGYCKHRLAKALYRRASEVVLEAPPAVSTALEAAPAPSQPTPAPLPEAPASVNLHLEIDGRQVQLTLRDSDEGRLLERLEAVLQRFPRVVTPTDTSARQDGWCSTHGVAMKLNHGKNGSTWYSHKTADGWCKGR
jgi:hypothetical protein